MYACFSQYINQLIKTSQSKRRCDKLPDQSMNYQFEQSTTFYTDVKAKQSIESSKLRTYVDKLTDKIAYAKWKQNLVLKFNYMPIKDMIEKIEVQKLVFQKKIAEEQQKCRKVLEDKQMLQQLFNFNKFSEMIDVKLQELENSILEASKNRDKLRRTVEVKQKELERKTKQVMTLQTKKLDLKGIKNFDDILNVYKQNRKKLSKTNSQHRQSVPSLNLKAIDITDQLKDSNRGKSITERKPSISSIENPITTRKKKNVSKWKPLFVECLNSILQQYNQNLMNHRVQLQKKSKNILTNKKSQETLKANKRSHSQFQLRGYNQGQFAQRVAINFQCNWENFQYLSWKQIIRYVLSQKGGAQKMRDIL